MLSPSRMTARLAWVLLVALLLMLAAFALPAGASAQQGAQITKPVRLYALPKDGERPISTLMPKKTCVAQYPVRAMRAHGATADRPASPYYLLELAGRDMWVKAAQVRRTVSYKRPWCGVVRGDLELPARGTDRMRYQRMLVALDTLSEQLGKPLFINGGYRTYEEQRALYQSFLAGRGFPANPPGSSRHERGYAADVEIGTRAQTVNAVRDLGRDPRAKRAAQRLGLRFPHAHEPWHVELG